MIVRLNYIYQTKCAKLEKGVNEQNVQSILYDIDGFISENLGMGDCVCEITIIGDDYGMDTVVRMCKKFDNFDLYSFIENQIYHYLY